MITRIRTFTAAVGKAPEVVALLKEIAETAARLSGRPVPPVAVTVGGDLSEVSLIMHGDGVDMHDEVLTKAVAHPEVAPLLEKLWLRIDSVYDSIYRHM